MLLHLLFHHLLRYLSMRIRSFRQGSLETPDPLVNLLGALLSGCNCFASTCIQPSPVIMCQLVLVLHRHYRGHTCTQACPCN